MNQGVFVLKKSKLMESTWSIPWYTDLTDTWPPRYAAGMFAVFSVSGRVVSGTLEQLRDVAPVRATSRLRGVSPTGSDEETSDQNSARTDHDFVHIGQGALRDPSRGFGATAGSAQSALAAYTDISAPHPQAHKRPLTQVADVMSSRVTTVQDDMPLVDAWQLLADSGVGQAPVLNAQNRLVGLLLRADMMQGAALPHPATAPAAWLALWRQTVAELMWTPVPSVGIDADIRQVAEALLRWHLPGLPVADEVGTVTGFIARSDILRAVVADPPLDLWG
jgi:CBS domain-containing protein